MMWLLFAAQISRGGINNALDAMGQQVTKAATNAATKAYEALTFEFRIRALAKESRWSM